MLAAAFPEIEVNVFIPRARINNNINFYVED